MRLIGVVFAYFLAGTIFFFSIAVVWAISSPWFQSDWSGGSGQTAFSDATKYSAAGNARTTTANQVTLTTQNVGNTGTGDDGAITVSLDKNINTANMISGRSCSDGGDAVNYSVTTSIASGASSITLSSVPASGCLTTGDEVLIINLQGTSGDNSNVGRYETATIQSISSGTLTLSGTLSNSYDGTTQKIMVQRVPNYTNVTINGSTTLTASAWNGTKGGVLFFRANGTVTVTGAISANNLGYRGGTNNVNGESYDGSVGTGGAIGISGTNGGGSGSGDTSASPVGTRGGGGASGAVNSGGDQGAGGGAGGGYGGGGGGGGGGADCNATAGTGGTGGGAGISAGGGGGGMWNGGCNLPGNGGNAGSPGGGANGSNASEGGVVGNGSATGGGGGGGRGDGPGGTGGVGSGGGGGGGTYGSSDLSTLFFGSGGGGGNIGGNNGQTGGGIISISANTLTNSGSITSNGADATSASSESGAGGAGAGGSILLSANTMTIGSATVTASGGSKTNGTVKGGGGGGGGVGRIAVYSANSISGTSSPSYVTTSPSYNSSGSLTSSVFDSGLTGGVTWGTLTYAATTPTNTAVALKVRTGSQPDLSDATVFTSCATISSGVSVATNSCVTTGRYAQYLIALSTSDTSVTPTLTSFSLSFTAAPSSGSSSSSSEPSVDSCSISLGAPDLFQIDADKTSVTLHFKTVTNATGYQVSYGLNGSANQYGDNFSYSGPLWILEHQITKLASNTTYYFKVKATNGCNSSNNSQVISVTTKGAQSVQASFDDKLSEISAALKPPTLEQAAKTVSQIPVVGNIVDKKIVVQKVTMEPKPNIISYVTQTGDTLLSIANKFLGQTAKVADIFDLNKITYPNLNLGKLASGMELKIDLSGLTPKQVEQVAPQTLPKNGYDLDVKILADAGTPLVGAKVTLHSNPQTTVTDNAGVAHFSNVEGGKHQVFIAYNGFDGGGQAINVTGDNKNLELIMQIKLVEGFSVIKVAWIVSIMGGVIAFLLFIILKNKKEFKLLKVWNRQ